MLTDKRSEHVFRMVRRGRRFNRFYRQRLLLRWVFFLAVLFFMCCAPFALKFFSRGNLESRALNVQEGKKLSSGADKPRSNHTRRYFPCKIGFSESVTEVVGPMNFLNFSKFLLDYIELEDIPSTTNFFEPRFGGHQSLQEREKSFYAENQTLHCGFVKGPPQFPGTGFDFDEKDRTYMNNCEVVVSSCIFGSSDFLRRPTSRMVYSLHGYSKEKNVTLQRHCQQCLLIHKHNKTNIFRGKIINLKQIKHKTIRRHAEILWRIVVVKNLPYKDMRRTGKVPKFLSHRLFPSARYSIWLDSKMRLQADPMLIIEFLLWRTSSEYAISNHYDRHCVWEEVLRNKVLNKYDHMAIDEQFLFYQSDGLTKFDPSDPNNLLPSYVPEGSFIVRAHTPMSNLFSCLWFNEVDRFTSRDQLSFAYMYLKLRRMNPQRPFYLNMFKDCERRQMTKLFKHRQLSPTSAT